AAAVRSVVPALTGPVPAISGTAAVGRTLTAKTGTWAAGTTLAFRWYRSGKAIKGATHKTYRLVAADRGKRLTVRVRGTKTGYAPARRSSEATRAVAAGKLKTSTPRITGTRKAGRTLTAKTGTWAAGTTLAYRWYRSGKAIKGATHKTYRLVAADRKDKIRVRVTGSKPGYTTVRKYSAATSRIR
ncbi:hypothetical protein ACFQ36_22875, partial [Arthrobacter sp. GCM10027362]